MDQESVEEEVGQGINKNALWMRVVALESFDPLSL